MKKRLAGIIFITMLGIGVFTFVAQGPNIPSEPFNIEDPPTIVEKESEPKSIEDGDENQQTSELSDNKEKSLSNEIKEAVAQVIDSTKDLFVKDDLNIVAIGDSLTQGVGDRTDNAGYVGILERALKQRKENKDIHISNFGKRGNRTDQMLVRMKKEEISTAIKEADIILITIGANDVIEVVKTKFQNLNYKDFLRAQTQYQSNLRKIFDQMIKLNPNANIYLIGIYNPFEKYFSEIPELNKITSDWNNIGRQVVNKYDQDQATFIPIKDLFHNQEQDLFYKDNFHPNEFGYKLIAQRVLDYIKLDIQKKDTP